MDLQDPVATLTPAGPEYDIQPLRTQEIRQAVLITACMLDLYISVHVLCLVSS